jgi:1-acyl-sn-glycerol-3-phosphate acyltransferase
MASTDIEPSELTKWDPGLTERVMGITRPFLTRYFRSEVRGLQNIPPGGALLVSNHSGGMLPMDVPILAAQYYHEHGYGRPLYTLSHDMLSVGPTGDFFKKIGYISANHENADAGGPAVWWWYFLAAITTCTGRLCLRTSSTSAAVRGT